MLLDKERKIKLIDFGLADDCSGGRRLEGLEHGGSPSYLAPEVIIDDEDVEIGFGVDIWSLGVVLYALLAGALPFRYGAIFSRLGLTSFAVMTVGKQWKMRTGALRRI